MDKSREEAAPERLGRYDLVKKIGAGGMAAVYLGRMVSQGAFERSVAIKVLHAELARDPGFVAMFLDEARVVAQIRHPNVVDVYDVETEGAQTFIVMQYIEGASVAELVDAVLKLKIQIPRGIVVRMMLDALLGLHAAHDLKDARGAPLDIVHRDVSPQNLLVGRDGSTRVTDFGVVKSAGRLATTGTRNTVKGKARYLAPEQMQADIAIDRRVDVFSAGVILWELLTGSALFPNESFPDTLVAVLTKPIPRPGTLSEGLPQAVEDVCMKALSRKREERFATAGDFADALEAAALGTIATPKMVGRFVRDIGPDLSQRGLLARPPGRESPHSAVRAVVASFTPGKSGAASFGGQTSFVASGPVPTAPRSSPENAVPPPRRSAPGLREPLAPARRLDLTATPAPVAVTSLSEESDDPPTLAVELNEPRAIPSPPERRAIGAALSTGHDEVDEAPTRMRADADDVAATLVRSGPAVAPPAFVPPAAPSEPRAPVAPPAAIEAQPVPQMNLEFGRSNSASNQPVELIDAVPVAIDPNRKRRARMIVIGVIGASAMIGLVALVAGALRSTPAPASSASADGAGPSATTARPVAEVKASMPPVTEHASTAAPVGNAPTDIAPGHAAAAGVSQPPASPPAHWTPPNPVRPPSAGKPKTPPKYVP